MRKCGLCGQFLRKSGFCKRDGELGLEVGGEDDRIKMKNWRACLIAHGDGGGEYGDGVRDRRRWLERQGDSLPVS